LSIYRSNQTILTVDDKTPLTMTLKNKRYPFNSIYVSISYQQT